MPKNLHGENAYFMLTGNHLGPHVGVYITVFRDELRVVDEFQCLTITFQITTSFKFNTRTMFGNNASNHYEF